MGISITEFKQHCLKIVRQVERSGKPVTITRHGRIVAQLGPLRATPGASDARPWERLQGRARWLAEPEETFVSERDFKGL
ncbi:MAG: type II toxin-antitoxin system Phd/YefM family antitoxin [Gammaproteobacteria bacterium]|nr:type II toxin-antitoxin system Phd/YefM family antitoxin [Gammaproteobacteria bacterium]